MQSGHVHSSGTYRFDMFPQTGKVLSLENSPGGAVVGIDAVVVVESEKVVVDPVVFVGWVA